MTETEQPASLDNRTYQIYALLDPRDNSIRYVGLSTNAQARFYGHLSGNESNFEERRWIAELRQLGLSPLLQILEAIDAGIDAYHKACNREYCWINEMLRQGCTLLNVAGVTRSYSSRGIRDTSGFKRIAIDRKVSRGKQAKVEIPEKVRKPSTEWLSVEDVAKELKVNPERVRGWIRRKELLAYRIGGKEYRIKREDLNAFLQGGRTFDDDQQDRD
jgi:excisionase family DNA binding protein